LGKLKERRLFVGDISMAQEQAAGIRRDVDREKAVEVLLYVTGTVADMYTALKVIYFADRMHLEKYGRLIYRDRYIAMAHGPVPSVAYDLVKGADGYPGAFARVRGSECFSVVGYRISGRRAPDLEFLSESDIECLDAAIREYGSKSFNFLRNKSHDEAWESADRNDNISIEALARSLKGGEDLLEHIGNG
jgi:uncharacterized phage-associated protein